jgi:hypothetical protein
MNGFRLPEFSVILLMKQPRSIVSCKGIIHGADGFVNNCKELKKSELQSGRVHDIIFALLMGFGRAWAFGERRRGNMPTEEV